ncbi:acyl-CoA thioesterase [Loigolactobacillus rennini]|nr:hotdog domain-containing protein [Loigolactobacillus rennini]
MERKWLYQYRTGDFYVEPYMLNHLNILHGGELVRQCDSAIGLLASAYAGTSVLTAAIKEFSFKRRSQIGDHINFEVSLIETSSRTMTFYATINLERLNGTNLKVGETIFIFVAVNKDFKPITIPTFTPKDINQKQFIKRIKQQFHL